MESTMTAQTRLFLCLKDNFGVLVRPDGVLCWRAGPGKATGPAIAAALRRALGDGGTDA